MYSPSNNAYEVRHENLKIIPNNAYQSNRYVVNKPSSEPVEALDLRIVKASESIGSFDLTHVLGSSSQEREHERAAATALPAAQAAASRDDLPAARASASQIETQTENRNATDIVERRPIPYIKRSYPDFAQTSNDDLPSSKQYEGGLSMKNNFQHDDPHPVIPEQSRLKNLTEGHFNNIDRYERERRRSSETYNNHNRSRLESTLQHHYSRFSQRNLGSTLSAGERKIYAQHPSPEQQSSRFNKALHGPVDVPSGPLPSSLRLNSFSSQSSRNESIYEQRFQNDSQKIHYHRQYPISRSPELLQNQKSRSYIKRDQSPEPPPSRNYNAALSPIGASVSYQQRAQSPEMGYHLSIPSPPPPLRDQHVWPHHKIRSIPSPQQSSFPHEKSISKNLSNNAPLTKYSESVRYDTVRSPQYLAEHLRSPDPTLPLQPSPPDHHHRESSYNTEDFRQSRPLSPQQECHTRHYFQHRLKQLESIRRVRNPDHMDDIKLEPISPPQTPSSVLERTFQNGSKYPHTSSDHLIMQYPSKRQEFPQMPRPTQPSFPMQQQYPTNIRISSPERSKTETSRPLSYLERVQLHLQQTSRKRRISQREPSPIPEKYPNINKSDITNPIPSTSNSESNPAHTLDLDKKLKMIEQSQKVILQSDRDRISTMPPSPIEMKGPFLKPPSLPWDQSQKSRSQSPTNLRSPASNSVFDNPENLHSPANNSVFDNVDRDSPSPISSNLSQLRQFRMDRDKHAPEALADHDHDRESDTESLTSKAANPLDFSSYHSPPSSVLYPHSPDSEQSPSASTSSSMSMPQMATSSDHLSGISSKAMAMRQILYQQQKSRVEIMTRLNSSHHNGGVFPPQPPPTVPNMDASGRHSPNQNRFFHHPHPHQHHHHHHHHRPVLPIASKGKRGRPRKHAPKIPLPPLYVFIRNLLHNRIYNPKVISWVNESAGIFKVNNTNDFAKTWGRMKSNRSEEMNYEKMSRAMRYHYGNEKQGRKGHLAMVKEKRLVYRFGELAINWRISEVTLKSCDLHELCKGSLCLWTKE